MKLYTLATVGGETAGFLLPIFQAHENANQKLVQQIDEDNNVISFEPLLVDNCEPHHLVGNVEAHVGKSAIWAFRDQRDELHIGTFREIQAVGLQLLKSKSLSDCPMAAAEMAAFCQVEAQYPNVIKSAMKALSRLSKIGAQTWRDTVLLLPLIKQDIAEQLKHRSRAQNEIHDVVAFTRGTVTHIYAPPSIKPIIAELPRWGSLAAIFGISKFEVHTLRQPAKVPTSTDLRWSVFGIGGIARYVITRSPFFGMPNDLHAPAGGAAAHGSIRQPVAEPDGCQLLLSIMASDLVHAYRLEQIAESEYARRAMKHAINVRPIGFGTPKTKKLSPSVLLETLPSYDCIWVVANHRQRQTSVAAPSLSASNTASRFVRAAAQGLIACLGSQEGISLLKEAGSERGYGLVGASRFYASLGLKELAKRVLYSMLCEDLYLHSAKKITLLWPYAVDERDRQLRVKIGAHTYEVEVITRPISTGHYDVVGFATNLQQSTRTPEDFRDFCSSLVYGYGWNVRDSDGRSLLLENEGEAMSLWPIVSTSIGDDVICTHRPSRHDLIVTNGSVPRAMGKQVKLSSRNVVHYSELGHWMHTHYRMRLFDDT